MVHQGSRANNASGRASAATTAADTAAVITAAECSLGVALDLSAKSFFMALPEGAERKFLHGSDSLDCAYDY